MNQGSAAVALSTKEKSGPPQFPALMSDKQSAAYLGVSIRKFHYLRHEAWMPRPIELGPRFLRWAREDLDRAVLQMMPRQAAAAPEPLQLAKARASRSGWTEVTA